MAAFKTTQKRADTREEEGATQSNRLRINETDPELFRILNGWFEIPPPQRSFQSVWEGSLKMLLDFNHQRFKM